MAKITTSLFGELAFLPYQAEAPVKETLEFLTDLLTSFNGSEQRFSMRTKPRQSFEYTIPLQAWQTAAAFNTEYAAIAKRWAVPIWTEAQFIGDVAAHATEINCNTSLYDLRASSLALLYSSPDVWQIVEISTTTSTKINVANDLSGITGAWLLPVRLGWIVGSVDKPTNGHNGKSYVTFEIDDNLEITPAAPTQHLSNDIYYDVPLRGEDNVSKFVQRRVDIVDYSLGPVVRRSPWLNSRYGTPYRSLLNGASEVRSYKNFLYRRSGKYRSFWMPSFENNFRLVSTGNINSTIVVESDSLNDWSLRTNIAIQATDGNWYPRVVSNPVQVVGNRLQLTLSSPLNVNASNIARISFLGLYRFDADKIELRWIGNGIVETEVSILEITP